VMVEDAILQRPPQPISLQEIVPTTLPEAWHGDTTTALDIANALSTKVGKTLPWYTVREAITNAIHSRWLETTIDSGPWPSDYAGARNVRLSLPQEQPARSTSASASTSAPPTVLRESVVVASPGQLIAEANLKDYEIQNLADLIGELTKETVGLKLTFHLRVELGPTSEVSEATLAKVNELLAEVSEELRLRRREF
jgi:hypothetical protein